MKSSSNGSIYRYIDSSRADALLTFSDAFYHTIKANKPDESGDIVFVCIGTDRSTGDSLGPLIGYKLKALTYKHVHVFGDLDNPVHAKNISETACLINQKFDRPFIIAIDACLGKMDHVGFITVGSGAIRPGSAVNKSLDPIGDIYITGIVNFSGFADFLILQNTRLSLVMKIADIISNGIKYTLWKMSKEDMLSGRSPLNQKWLSQ